MGIGTITIVELYFDGYEILECSILSHNCITLFNVIAFSQAQKPLASGSVTLTYFSSPYRAIVTIVNELDMYI